MVIALEADAWVAVLGTMGGLLIGMFAPFLTQRALDRSTRRQAQAGIARGALALFEGDQSLEGLLTGPTSPARRRLFLLASQLHDVEARQACFTLVAVAGEGANDLEDVWAKCVQALGRVARTG